MEVEKIYEEASKNDVSANSGRLMRSVSFSVFFISIIYVACFPATNVLTNRSSRRALRDSSCPKASSTMRKGKVQMASSKKAKSTEKDITPPAMTEMTM